MQKPLIIGLSPRFYHPEGPQAVGLLSKTRLYLEQSVVHWVMRGNVLAVMVPSIEAGGELKRSDIRLTHYVDRLDGLVLQGGADLAPEGYGEQPLKPDWAGDRVRDRYELELFRAFVAQRKPVLGICRGCQLINVAFGGTLYQDIATQLPDAIEHTNPAKYDRNFHELTFEPDSRLAALYPDASCTTVNTIHHQAIKDLGENLFVEARSAPDRLVEAIRWSGPSYVLGVQWHPEFHDPRSKELLDGGPILREFLAAARERLER